ncbi:flagellar basal body-associated FliL family protein [Paenibacillus mendelii]|uniref:Flagellar protein FliL n=1 Tax=Paenibacillus mendelii TaxID=206163 RepID=A0ABV6JHT2_9BACL|nr:flagellar basal body-associated FliL family protein [Paenibacillus mendelii]MCQ6557911.1 flagellar basal body-associated FliL family protein [Paenibacillus mendelii]
MKKMLPWLITILLAITLIAIVAIILLNNILGDDKNSDPQSKAANSVKNVQAERISADKRVGVTSEIKDISTNLIDAEFVVKVDFAFQLENKKTKEDFDKIKDIVIKPIIISTLGDMTPEGLNGSKGKDELKSKLLNLINQKLLETTEGKLVNVDITNIIIAQM